MHMLMSVTVALVSFAYMASVCALPSTGSCPFVTCDFYPCFNDYYPCGNSSYAIAYGLKYCNAFTSAEPSFSVPHGREWVASTRLCLQVKLWEASLNFTDDTTCDDIQNIAFQAHVGCYVAPAPNVSICDIPQDWFRVVNVMKDAFLTDFSETVVEVIETIGNCTEIWSAPSKE